MTDDHPDSITTTWGNRHDYLPAAGNDLLLPAYDLIVRMAGATPVYRRLVEQADLSDGARVLEIGCGTGNLTSAVKRARPGVDLVAVDPDPRALARARRKTSGVAGLRIERAYAQRLQYADESFEVVLSSMMLHHLDAGVKSQVLCEALRVLTPGGSMHVADVADVKLPDLMRRNGFEVEELGSHRLRFVGPVAFYRATRPAS